MGVTEEIDHMSEADKTVPQGLAARPLSVEEALNDPSQLRKIAEQIRILELRGVGWIGDLDAMRRDS